MKEFIFCLSIVLNSCHESNSKTIRGIVNIVDLNEDSTQLHINEFEMFWIEFGKAIRENDSNKIINLSESTLQLIGRDDLDPKIKVTSTEIAKVVFLAINNGGYFDSQKNIDVSNRELFLTDLSRIVEFDPDGTEQWISDFVFKKTDNGWKLSVLYFNTNTYKQ